MKKSTQTIEISPATHKRLKRVAQLNDWKIRALADKAIEAGLAEILEREAVAAFKKGAAQ